MIAPLTGISALLRLACYHGVPPPALRFGFDFLSWPMSIAGRGPNMPEHLCPPRRPLLCAVQFQGGIIVSVDSRSTMGPYIGECMLGPPHPACSYCNVCPDVLTPAYRSSASHRTQPDILTAAYRHSASHPTYPGPAIIDRLLYNQRGCHCCKGWCWKDLGESFPCAYRPVSAPSLLWSNRAMCYAAYWVLGVSHVKCRTSDSTTVHSLPTLKCYSRWDHPSVETETHACFVVSF